MIRLTIINPSQILLAQEELRNWFGYTAYCMSKWREYLKATAQRSDFYSFMTLIGNSI